MQAMHDAAVAEAEARGNGGDGGGGDGAGISSTGLGSPNSAASPRGLARSSAAGQRPELSPEVEGAGVA